MTTYLVATLARYVLVDAGSESEAERLARPALHALTADIREKSDHDVPVVIHTVREATQEEIDLWNWHHTKLKEESER